ncbi:MAG: SpoIIE family protein phosphatase [Vicinamibacterales bacterium]
MGGGGAELVDVLGKQDRQGVVPARCYATSMEPAPASAVPDVRSQLIERRQRIEALVERGRRLPQLDELMREIDEAIERLSAGTYGFCETCGDPIEPERLDADPLVRFCIDHLTPSEAQALQEDLELAARVQQQLLPPRHLSEAGWEMAYDYVPFGIVSGDYCDVIRVTAGPSSLVFMVGDIAGKGVAASMLMAHLHASMRTLHDLGLPLPQVMERANRVLCDSTAVNHYATLVTGRLFPDGGLEMCNAGHCLPLLIKPGGVTQVDSAGLPLGMFCLCEYPPLRVTLAPGDLLVLYTDGVTEATNPEDEQYGVERLARVAAGRFGESPSAVASACVNDVRRFRRGSPPTDDVTVMAVRRQDGVRS